MGIARRKSGTVVRCPTCAGQVIVPGGDGAEEEAEVPPSKKGAADLLERSDIDEVLRPRGGSGGHAATVSSMAEEDDLPHAVKHPPDAWGTHAEAAGDPARVAGGVAVAVPAMGAFPQSTPAGGILLTQGKLAFLVVLIVLLLGIAFGAGVLVGKLMM